ncbi:hypothetical protein [Archaeoglobus veneficus]|uniref:DNA polymerase sliding clamp n=1 Tax=Archaeoglobus veneficus (strain DSM 11195 / SNP6) TaxID=693661 RepID=F2KRE8_ARCVS|nr:hypothetical protein [Archaeoglobus veneficus]AEA47882.1 hypothetical protein Arcve_1889 [Archaeoglobus veneficus SNP6]
MQEIIRVIRDSLLPDEFETVCVKLEPTIFKIFGINKISSIYYELKIKRSHFQEYPDISAPIKISVLTSDLKRLLLSALSEKLTELRSIEFSINPPTLDLTVAGAHSTLRESIREASDGIREEPPYFTNINFETFPHCEIDSPKDLRVIFEHFTHVLGRGDITPIAITLKEGKIEFALKTETKPTDTISGQGTGEARTYITSHSFKVIAKISDKATKAQIYVKDKGNIIIKYSFDFGTLEYLVSKTTMPTK